MDISTDLGNRFSPFFRKQGGTYLQQSVGFSAEETIRRCHERGNVPTLLEALEVYLLFLEFDHGVPANNLCCLAFKILLAAFLLTSAT
jgi:hypothetical protein